MRCRYLLSLFLLVWSAVSGVITEAQIVGPYLQSPTDTSIWITWKTASGKESKVIFGKDSANLSDTDTGSCQILSDEGYNNNYYYHSVRITGLEPDQFYYYRVATEAQSSITYRFRTQPSPGKSSSVYRFLIFGDHQVTSDDRYQRLLQAARDKVMEKFGGRVEDHINLIINDGDQVDEGTLYQYENVHLKPSSILSGNIPYMTTVGNHETYGSIGLPLYHAHFFYDDLGYKGIVSPGGENYYSYQQSNIVFIHLSSEHPVPEQTAWVQQIIDSVKTDTSVSWVISIAHRPIQAEQYVGDISVFIRDEIIPVLTQTKKSVLHITGHHHLYARGQLRDFPMFHIISGGGSWDQYWGQSTEKDFDDVQKTIDYWTYQIVSFDPEQKEMTVESYAIGSPKLGFSLENILIDSFYRKPDVQPPDKPAIVTIPSDTITLPYTFVSSAYSTVTGESYNSVQLQVSDFVDFSINKIDLIRDFENLYGTTGNPDYKPVDIHKNLDIFRYEITENQLPNGTYFIRTRHRDRNIEWSSWSDPVEFIIKGSSGNPSINLSLNKAGYDPGEEIRIDYSHAPGFPYDWIGIYHLTDVPGEIGSTLWKYTSGTQGQLTFGGLPAGYYFISYFMEDGYIEAGGRITFSVGSDLAVLSVDQPVYAQEQTITVTYSNGPGTAKDWVGILRKNASPGMPPLVDRQFINRMPSGSLDFGLDLDTGGYYAALFINNSSVRISNKAYFRIESATSNEYTQTGAAEITIFPVPSSGILTLKVPDQNIDRFSLKISTLAGTIVFYRQYNMSHGSGSHNLDLSGLPPGIYIAGVKSGDRYYFKKLVLQ